VTNLSASVGSRGGANVALRGRRAGAVRGARLARLVPLAILALLASSCLGHTGGGAVPAGSTLVQIYHMAYRPQVVTVRAGQEVTWRFEDAGVLHDVDSRTGLFKSPLQDSGTWTHRFTTPGTYDYYCSVHTYMVGEVVVLPAGG
jgi:plastocyanin